MNQSNDMTNKNLHKRSVSDEEILDTSSTQNNKNELSSEQRPAKRSKYNNNTFKSSLLESKDIDKMEDSSICDTPSTKCIETKELNTLANEELSMQINNNNENDGFRNAVATYSCPSSSSSLMATAQTRPSRTALSSLLSRSSLSSPSSSALRKPPCFQKSKAKYPFAFSPDIVRTEYRQANLNTRSLIDEAIGISVTTLGATSSSSSSSSPTTTTTRVANGVTRTKRFQNSNLQ